MVLLIPDPLAQTTERTIKILIPYSIFSYTLEIVIIIQMSYIFVHLYELINLGDLWFRNVKNLIFTWIIK